MTPEKAKQLKDAGFPQGLEAREGDIIPIKSFGYIRVPRLEEIIEECGEDFIDLFKLSKIKRVEWGFVWGCNTNLPLGFRVVLGQTPIEAVANLWLALNNKTV